MDTRAVTAYEHRSTQMMNVYRDLVNRISGWTGVAAEYATSTAPDRKRRGELWVSQEWRLPHGVTRTPMPYLFRIGLCPVGTWCRFECQGPGVSRVLEVSPMDWDEIVEFAPKLLPPPMRGESPE